MKVVDPEPLPLLPLELKSVIRSTSRPMRARTVRERLGLLISNSAY